MGGVPPDFEERFRRFAGVFEEFRASIAGGFFSFDRVVVEFESVCDSLRRYVLSVLVALLKTSSTGRTLAYSTHIVLLSRQV